MNKRGKFIKETVVLHRWGLLQDNSVLSTQLIKSSYLKPAKFTMISYCALCLKSVKMGPIPTPTSPEYSENV